MLLPPTPREPRPFPKPTPSLEAPRSQSSQKKGTTPLKKPVKFLQKPVKLPSGLQTVNSPLEPQITGLKFPSPLPFCSSQLTHFGALKQTQHFNANQTAAPQSQPKKSKPRWPRGTKRLHLVGISEVSTTHFVAPFASVAIARTPKQRGALKIPNAQQTRAVSMVKGGCVGNCVPNL